MQFGVCGNGAGCEVRYGRLSVEKRKRGATVYAAVLLVLAAFRIWIACHTNYAAVPTGPYDEELQVSLGLSLAAGQWLGVYNQYTLIKGIVYPLFLALCAELGITYGLGLGIVMVLAALLFQAMLGLVTKNRILRGVSYAYVLYSPAAMTSWSGLRIYRDALGPWLALILVSCLAAVWFLRAQPFRKSVPWFAGLAVSFMLFYNLREDGIWILPLAGVGLLMSAAGRVLAYSRGVLPESGGNGTKSFVRFVLPYLFCCLLPFAADAGWKQYLSQKNLAHYGIALPNDRVKGNFARVMSLISSVEDPEADQVHWITNRMLEQCVAASPSLKRMESEIEARRRVTAAGQSSDEVLGDYMQWVLRNALADAGFYKDGAKTEALLGQIASELEAAYGTGQLKKDGKIHLSSQGRGLEAGELAAYVGKTFGTLPKLAAYKGCIGFYPYHTACTGNLLQRYEVLLGIDLGRETVESAPYRSAAAAGTGLTALYRILGVILVCLCLAGTLAGTVQALRGIFTGNADVLPLVWGLLLSAFLLVYMVTIFTEFLDESFFYNYTSVFYALIPAAVCLTAAGMSGTFRKGC